MNGEFIGVWSWTDRGTHAFTYDESWKRSENVRPLSLSIPITHAISPISGPHVRNFFDNLLPDSEKIRDRIKSNFKLQSSSPNALLEAVGRDCVGALQIMPPGEMPIGWDKIVGIPLSDDDVDKILADTVSTNKFGSSENSNNDFRISIAGAQEKTALLNLNGKWYRPIGATPTTHIIKLPLGLVGNMRFDMSDSVENEWVCSKIIQAFDLPAAESDIKQFSSQKSLVVKRFDRKFSDDNSFIIRLPQEDFCQATGKSPDFKYEKDGGPGISNCLDILERGSSPFEDKRIFIKAQLAFWLLAATDGHAKNFSIFLQSGGSYALTPLYDVLSAWPIIGTSTNLLDYHNASLAMAIRSKNAHYKLAEIQTRHWNTLALRSGVPGLFDELVSMVNEVPAVLDAVEKQLPDDFPINIWESISKGMLKHQKRFQNDLIASKKLAIERENVMSPKFSV